MYALDKCMFITIPQQKILMVMYNNGKQIDFKKQKIYKNRRSFNKAMRQLANANIVKIKLNKKYKNWQNNYILTLNGIFLVEEVIRDFIESNKRKN